MRRIAQNVLVKPKYQGAAAKLPLMVVEELFGRTEGILCLALGPSGLRLRCHKSLSLAYHSKLFSAGASSCYALGIANRTISAGIIHSYAFKFRQLQSSRGRQLRYCVANSQYHEQRPSRVLRLQSRSPNLGHTRFDRRSPAGQRSFDFDRSENRSIGHLRRVSALA